MVILLIKFIGSIRHTEHTKDLQLALKLAIWLTTQKMNIPAPLLYRPSLGGPEGLLSGDPDI